MAKAKEVKEKSKKGSMADLVAKYKKNADWKDKIYDIKMAQDMKFIDTGSIVINKVLGVPGVAKGRLTEVYGPEASGKSTLVQTLALNTLKAKGRVLYLDYEQCFDTGYARQLGLNIDDPEHFVLAQPDTFEEGWGICREFLDKVEDLDLIIVDSIAAMTPAALLAQDVDKLGQIGLHAKMVGQFVTDLIKRIKKSETALVVVNQIRSRIKTSMYDAGPDTDTTGGKALKYYASVRLELKQRSIETISAKSDIDGTKIDKPVGMIAQVINRKNKIADPYKKADFAIRFGEGIDNIRSVIDIAENLGWIKKAGASFTFKEELNATVDGEYFSSSGSIVGKESVRNYLIKHSDVFANLVGKIVIVETEKAEDEIDELLNIKEETLPDETPDAATEEVLKVEQEKAASKRAKKTKTPTEEKPA